MNSEFLDEIEVKIDQLKAFVALQRVTLDFSAQAWDLRRDPRLKEAISQHDIHLVQLKRIHDTVGGAFNKLQRQRDYLASAISPIMSCPPEILVEIFEHTLSFDRLGYPLGSNARLVQDISHVCGEWRAVVLNRSEFWTYIHIWWDDELQNLFVMRSQGKPLHVFATRDDSTESYSLCDALVHASHRWKSFTTADVLNGEEALSDLQKITGHSLSALQRIAIIPIATPEYPYHTGVDMSAFRSPLPSLSSLSVAHFSLFNLDAVSSHLTDLDLMSTPFEWGDWESLPIICPNLETLVIGCQDMCSDIDLEIMDPILLETITFPKLRKLAIRGECHITFQWFIFHCVRAPQLRHLSISFSTRQDPAGEHPSIIQMRSKELFRFLRDLSLIERLTLSGDVSVLEFLSSPFVPSLSFLPNLKDLRICQVDRWSPWRYKYKLKFGIRKFLLSRNQPAMINLDQDPAYRPPPVLRKLVLVLAYEISPAYRIWLEEQVSKVDTPLALCPASWDEDAAIDLDDW